jgi:hypothetical protein
MTPNKILHYFIVADRSGSMTSQINEVRSELQRHLGELVTITKSTTTEVRFHFMMFNSRMEWLSNGEPIQDFDPKNLEQYKPEGMTALFDAVGMAIERAEYKIGNSLNPECDEVVIMVFSDGGENSSSKWRKRNLTELITSHQNLPGWTITFTGCDLTGFKDLANMKMRSDRMINYSANEKGKAFRKMSKFIEKNLWNDNLLCEAPYEKD